jgi:group I intron endonuclease
MNLVAGRIYKVVNNVDSEIFIGSTQLPIAQRMACYRKEHSKPKPHQIKLHAHFKKIGIKNFSVEMTEAYACPTAQDFRMRQRYWIEELKPSLNKSKPSTATLKKEYYQKYWKSDRGKAVQKEYHTRRKYLLSLPSHKRLEYLTNKHARLIAKYEAIGDGLFRIPSPDPVSV